jgi:hypothetical protein
MRVRGKFPPLAAAVAALALGLAGVGEVACQSLPTAQVDHGSPGGAPTKRASKGRK